jgi:hypothetical protein
VGRPAETYRVISAIPEGALTEGPFHGQGELNAYLRRWIPTLRGAYKGLTIDVTTEVFDRERLRWVRHNFTRVKGNPK